MGIGVARLQEYFGSLVIVMYLAVPNISRASFLETAIVSGRGMFAGCCPGRVAAPFSRRLPVIVSVYRRQNWLTTTSVTIIFPSVNVWSYGMVSSPKNTVSRWRGVENWTYSSSTVFFRIRRRFLHTTTHIRIISTANKTARIAVEVGITFLRIRRLLFPSVHPL